MDGGTIPKAVTLVVAESDRQRTKSASGSPARSERSNKSTENNASAMLDVKNNRKRAEADLQMLANRIALLRTEEQKALVKIAETKTRAKEIIIQKKRNEDDVQARMSGNMVREMETRAIQAKVVVDKQRAKVSLAVSKKAFVDERVQKAFAVKNEQRSWEEIHRRNKELVVEEKKQRALEVKKLEEERRKQRERERAAKEQAAQAEFVRRIEAEAKKTAEAEKLISVLEREELELIARLKAAQDLQKKAYSALQTSLDL